ncbi:unnamed protein product, partial [Musa acuminata subsp. burmannicoides]
MTRTRVSPDGCFSRLITDRLSSRLARKEVGPATDQRHTFTHPCRFALAADINDPRPQRFPSF